MAPVVGNEVGLAPQVPLVALGLGAVVAPTTWITLYTVKPASRACPT